MTSVRLKLGDSVDLMSRMGEACLDSIVCDPPYMLNFMGREWDRVVERSPKSAGGFGRESQTNENAYAAARVRYNSEGPAMQAWHERWLREAFRVLKPGAYLVAFGGSRTYHRLACAAEDVGFEVRDMLEWFYGSGFPKSLDVGKALDKAAGAEREVVGETGRCIGPSQGRGAFGGQNAFRESNWEKSNQLTAPTTDQAKTWEGWGTALKPAHEPILLARKPLQEKTVSAQVLSTGTGAMNVDGCRVEGKWTSWRRSDGSICPKKGYSSPLPMNRAVGKVEESLGNPEHPAGRWPSNVILSHSPACVKTGTRREYEPDFPGSKIIGKVFREVEAWECAPGCPVALLDQQSGESGASYRKGNKAATSRTEGWGFGQRCDGVDRSMVGYTDSGGASRFFPVLNWEPGEYEAAFLYQAKAAKAERNRGTEELYWRVTDTGLGVERIDLETWEQLGQEEERILHKFGKRVRLRTQGNIHSTVKPVALIRWLQRLVTPPNGVTYDPFLGSGTAAVAAVEEGFNFLGSELYSEHMDIAKARSLEALKRKGGSA